MSSFQRRVAVGLHGKRVHKELLAAQAARQAARDAVYQALQADPVYQRLWARKDRLGAAWNRADAYRDPTAPRLERLFLAACRRVSRHEGAALAAAGLTP